MTIREATIDDLEAVIDLLAALGKERLSLDDGRDRFAMIERDPEQEMWLACEGEKPVGIYTFRIRHNVERVSYYGEVSTLAVAATHRRSGVGRALIEHADQRARERGCIGLWLVSGNQRSEEAHRFYADLGFKGTGTRFIRDF